MLRLLQRSTLFPYTTLFRSSRERERPGRPASVRFKFPTRPASSADGFRRHAARSGQSFPRTRRRWPPRPACPRSEEHTSELQSHSDLVCRLLLEKKNEVELL